MVDWCGIPEEEKTTKAINKEKKYWSNQLRKANAVDNMSYGSGIVGQKYTVIAKAEHLIAHLEKKEDQD